MEYKLLLTAISGEIDSRPMVKQSPTVQAAIFVSMVRDTLPLPEVSTHLTQLQLTQSGNQSESEGTSQPNFGVDIHK